MMLSSAMARAEASAESPKKKLTDQPRIWALVWDWTRVTAQDGFWSSQAWDAVQSSLKPPEKPPWDNVTQLKEWYSDNMSFRIRQNWDEALIPLLTGCVTSGLLFICKMCSWTLAIALPHGHRLQHWDPEGHIQTVWLTTADRCLDQEQAPDPGKANSRGEFGLKSSGRIWLLSWKGKSELRSCL